MKPHGIAMSAPGEQRRIDWFERASHVAQVIASLGVVISLVFVGVQLRQNSEVLARSENTANLAQWQSIRQTLAANGDLAEIFDAGLDGKPLNRASYMRFQQLFADYMFATNSFWDRQKRGLVNPQGRLPHGIPTLTLRWVCTPGGHRAWVNLQDVFPKDFVADLDAALAEMPPAACAALQVQPAAN
jgi:hypothetical protein